MGASLLAGVTLAAQQHDVRVVVFDTRSDPSVIRSGLRAFLIDERPAVVIGDIASSLTSVVAEESGRVGIPVVIPTSTRGDLTSIGDHVVRLCVTDDVFGRAMARFARERLRLTRVAIARDASSDYSVLVADAFARELAALGGIVAVDVPYRPDAASFRELLPRIQASAPDAIFVPGYHSDAARFAVDARAAGIAVPLLGTDGWDAPALLANPEAARALEGSFYAAHWFADAGWPEAQRFTTGWRAAHRSEPDSIAALGYDALQFVVRSSARVAGQDAASLRDALVTARPFEGATGTIRVTAAREADRTVVVVAVRQGRAEFGERVDPR